MSELAAPAARLRDALADASRGLVERDVLVQLIALSAVAGEHLLVIGPPGTAKSEAVRRVATGLGGNFFEYLLGRFTEPGEIFGPVDLKRLRDGVVEARTEGMLPEADVAFLDEVFLGSTAILNTLLGLLQDRVYRRGSTLVRSPLRVCVGASNALPADPALSAFADRFLLRVFVTPVLDPDLEALLEAGWSGTPANPRTASLSDVDALATAARRADLAPVRRSLAGVVRTLRAQGVRLSDRRVVKLQKLVAAAAVLAGRECPNEADLWPIVYAVPDAEGQALAKEALRELLASSENEALAAAAEDAAAGPVARAARLARAGEALLAEDGDVLSIEGVLREIDAGFDPDALPESLDALRPRLVAALER